MEDNTFTKCLIPAFYPYKHLEVVEQLLDLKATKFLLFWKTLRACFTVTASCIVFPNEAIKKFFDCGTLIDSHFFISLNQTTSFRQDARIKESISAWLYGHAAALKTMLFNKLKINTA